MSKKLLVGTSGWSYDHWGDIFYPAKLASVKRLAFFAQHFETVEVNSSFYHLMPRKTFANWRQSTPDDFVFAVKASRFITHVKKINDVEEPLEKFFESAEGLEEKLGPILFQLPPNFKKNEERLANLLKLLPKKHRYAFEFRHESWFTEEIYQLLKEKQAALCLADSPRWPLELVTTAPFVFIRMHGGAVLYGSKYSEEELKKWAKRIRGYLKDGIDAYVYFNNDAYGYAIENAKSLREMLI